MKFGAETYGQRFSIRPDSPVYMKKIGLTTHWVLDLQNSICESDFTLHVGGFSGAKRSISMDVENFHVIDAGLGEAIARVFGRLVLLRTSERD